MPIKLTNPIQLNANCVRGEAFNLRGQKVDSSNTSFYGHIIGLTAGSGTAGFAYDLVLYGELTNPAWSWTPNQLLYLNGSLLSATPPTSGFVQQLAVAKTSDTVFVSPQLPYLL
jgi:hypothetical protein